MKIKNILFICPSANFFNEYFFRRVIKIFKKNYNIIVISGEKPKKKYGFITYKTININRSHLNPLRLINEVFLLKKVVKKYNPLVINNSGFKQIFTSSILTFFTKYKSINFFTGLGFLFYSQNILHIITRKIIFIYLKCYFKNKNTYSVFENQYDRNFFLKKKIIKKNSSYVINGCGIDLKKSQIKLKKKNNIKVLLATRLLHDKGIFIYINAIRFLKKKYNNKKLEFYIAGSFDHKNPSSIKKDFFLRECRSNEILYLGNLKNLNRLINNFDIFCHCSFHEGLPRVLLEAMFNGLSPIVSNISGHKIVVKNKFNGLIYDTYNHEELAIKIIKLANNIKLMKRIKKNAKKTIITNFGQEKIFEKTQKVYKQILND
jgi:glycosyltransferase involved in cell wall biosynthesis